MGIGTAAPRLTTSDVEPLASSALTIWEAERAKRAAARARTFTFEEVR